MAPTRKQSNPPPESPEPPPPPPIHDPEWVAGFYLRRRLERARIPARYAAKDLDNFETRGDKLRKVLVQNAKAYISGFNFSSAYPNGLLMSGPVGCGKSHVAVAILRGIISKGYSGLYYNSPDLLRDIRATFEKDADLTEDMLLEEVTTTDLLVFDDVGAENSTPFVLDRFYLIVNERYEGCKPVIVTSNLAIDELEGRLGKRMVSRLLEMCETFGPFPEEDYRRKKMR